jgi:hypothetical protein
MTEVVKDYLWMTHFEGIDNDKLYNTCTNVETILSQIFPEPKQNGYGCFTSYYHKEYNLFHFPCNELSALFRNMCSKFPEVIKTGENYYIRCWVNLFGKNKNIPWHKHWDAEERTYHGFYCVNTEGENESYTEYQIPGLENICRITSKDGLCVIGKSDGDYHRASEWLNEGKYRVTIAFDIIPCSTLRPKEVFTHMKSNLSLLHNYIPIVI